MKKYIEKLQAYAVSSDTSKDAPATILELLYDAYGEYHNTEDEAVREAFGRLYESMHGKTLQEEDEIVYAACSLCREHERTGFSEGVKVGLRLMQEVKEE